MALKARATGAGSATGVGLAVAPRRLTAFAMRVAAETRGERLRVPGVVVEPALRRFLVGVAAVVAAAGEVIAAPSPTGWSFALGRVRCEARREAVGDGAMAVDIGAALATVERGCEALVLDSATFGSAPPGLVVLVLAAVFTAGLAAVLAGTFAEAFAEDGAVTVLAGFAVDRAGVVRCRGAGAAAGAAEDTGAAALEALLTLVVRRPETLAAVRAGRVLAGLSIGEVWAVTAAWATRWAVLLRALAAALRAGAGAADRVRWESTRAHSSSLRLAGLAPWAWATRAAFSMSATRLVQEVAKRLSDWDLAPLSTRVSITPAAVTFLRRRLKISFCNWAIKASALSLRWIVS